LKRDQVLHTTIDIALKQNGSSWIRVGDFGAS
jgi:hypothetical protein